MVTGPATPAPPTTGHEDHPGAPVGAPGWLSPQALADLVDRCRRTDQMSAIERSLITYLDDLREDLFDQGEAANTASGITFCGCADCQAREVLAHVVPPLTDLVAHQLHPAGPPPGRLPHPRSPKE